jgi:two-component system, OmpR family, sensor histidine kinase TctE
VFEAFHRLRPRATGTGLGLSLVRQVVERHHGRVVILDAPRGGTLVRVTLPAA